MGPELDIYYMRNRWYEPATGRFLSEDPIGLQGGINPLMFGGADPVNRRDAAGLDFRLTDDPQECLALGMRVAVRGGRLGCEDGAFPLPGIDVTAPPPAPVDPVKFPDPPCPECNSPRDPTQGTPTSQQGPSCTERAVETAISVAFDLAGAGLIKRSKTLFEGGVRWFTLAGKLPPGRGTVRRGLGAAQFAESRHAATQAQGVLRIGAVFSAITISDLPDAVGFFAGFVPGVGGLVSGAIGVGQVIACLTSQES